MAQSSAREAIVVLQASVAHDDPAEIVWSNAWFVSALLEEHLTADDIASNALRSYHVDYYLCEMNNGGFSQFVYNSRWNPLVVRYVREGMLAIEAQRHLAVFESGVKLVERFGHDGLEAYFAGEYFGDNIDRDTLNGPNDKFFAVEEVESLLALNAAWLRSNPNLCAMQTEAQMRQEVRRRGQALPDRERRVAEALANEPRFMKLIRALCKRAGQELEHVTAGDPTRVHEGKPTIAWHFITD